MEAYPIEIQGMDFQEARKQIEKLYFRDKKWFMAPYNNRQTAEVRKGDQNQASA